MKKTIARHSIILLSLLVQWQIGAIVHFYGPLHAASSCCQAPEPENESVPEGHDTDNCIFLTALTASPTTVASAPDGFVLAAETAHTDPADPDWRISPPQPLYRLSPAQSPPGAFSAIDLSAV